MPGAEAVDQGELITKLRPSAWLREGIADPDNAVAILGKKGGPGKTTTSELLLDAGARFGLNMLALDGDPQGNLSIALDSEVTLVPTGKSALGGKQVMEPDRDTMVEVLEADTDGVIDEAFQMVPWPYKPEADFTRGGPLIPGRMGTLAIVPAHNVLEDISRGWNLHDLNRLNRALNKPATPNGVIPRERWDVVVADLLPGGSDLARALLKAMQRYVLLTTAEPFGMKAIANTLTFARDIRDNWGNPRLSELGLILTSYNPKGRVSRTEVAELREAQAAGDESVDVPVWDPKMPSRTLVPHAQGFRAPISYFLSESGERAAATELCQVAEAILLNILSEIGHPDAQELRDRWKKAWGDKLSPWATGEIAKVKKEAG